MLWGALASPGKGRRVWVPLLHAGMAVQPAALGHPGVPGSPPSLEAYARGAGAGDAAALTACR